jgi:hypothetical protein
MRSTAWVTRHLYRFFSTWRITGIILVAALVQGFALWLFSGGFLLSRVSVPLTSSITSPVIQLPPAKVEPILFKKLVIIIVDALRLDFLVEQPYSRQGNHVASMPRVLCMAKSLV